MPWVRRSDGARHSVEHRPGSSGVWTGVAPGRLASILFVLLIVDGNRLAVAPQLQAVVVLTVFLSTMLHGVTAYPLMVRYASLVEKMGDASMPEHRYGPDLPVRIRHASDHPQE